jgi:hypothetical protein
VCVCVCVSVCVCVCVCTVGSGVATEVGQHAKNALKVLYEFIGIAVHLAPARMDKLKTFVVTEHALEYKVMLRHVHPETLSLSLRARLGVDCVCRMVCRPREACCAWCEM